MTSHLPNKNLLSVGQGNLQTTIVTRRRTEHKPCMTRPPTSLDANTGKKQGKPTRFNDKAGLMEQLVFSNRPLFALITKTGTSWLQRFCPRHCLELLLNWTHIHYLRIDWSSVCHFQHQVTRPLKFLNPHAPSRHKKLKKESLKIVKWLVMRWKGWCCCHKARFM